MRKALIAGAVATVGMIGTGGVAAADPTHTAEEFVCNGEDFTIFTAGRNGWVDGVKYQAVMFTIEGPDFSDVKVWGGGKDLNNPDAITCVAEAEGVTVTVLAVPA
jgi:hypothetical protein